MCDYRLGVQRCALRRNICKTGGCNLHRAKRVSARLQARLPPPVPVTRHPVASIKRVVSCSYFTMRTFSGDHCSCVAVMMCLRCVSHCRTSLPPFGSRICLWPPSCTSPEVVLAGRVVATSLGTARGPGAMRCDAVLCVLVMLL